MLKRKSSCKNTVVFPLFFVQLKKRPFHFANPFFCETFYCDFMRIAMDTSLFATTQSKKLYKNISHDNLNNISK